MTSRGQLSMLPFEANSFETFPDIWQRDLLKHFFLMATHIIFQCPVCQERRLTSPSSPEAHVQCSECGWQRNEGAGDFENGHLKRCRICGCDDVWRQKDFPPGLGLAMAGTAAILSCIAWAMYQPVVALVILMLAALIDMVLYSWMGDMLVCYRCGARHRQTPMDEQHPGFNLETAERYRQQQKSQARQETAG